LCTTVRAEPRATYRVQLHSGFGFDPLIEIVPYLAALGVSHVYCSPILQACPGSTHGYDVIDPGRVRDELGGEGGFERLCAALERHGLDQLLDIVPNHMAISGRGNPWWWDVLENGPASRYAPTFDVDWDPPEAKLRNTVLMPILGDQYGKVLEDGEIWLTREQAAFTIRYHEHLLPVAPRSLDDLLARAAERCHSAELGFLADSFARLPIATVKDPQSLARRHRDKEILLRLCERLGRERPDVARAIDEEIAATNANPDLLHRLLERQNYRLAYWRTAARELGYRRFFDINTLVALRIEDEQVFMDTHELLLQFVAEGKVSGLRVDHPDGLRDPEQYFQRLCVACPDAWIVAEKILASEEHLPSAWPIAGTTGYDFLVRAGGLFVDPAGEAPLTALYGDFTGESTDFAAVAREKKHQVLREGLGSDVDRLTGALLDICERHRRHRDHTRDELRQMLREVLACFPVYRTYVRADHGEVREEDLRTVGAAIEAAKRNRADLSTELLDFFHDLLLLRIPGEAEHDFVMRFQQLSGAVMAKGVEDTAFYVYLRLAALNEVGGDPSRFGTSPEEFHQANAFAQAHWPAAMLTTSTHDTKRSLDVRSRIALLSEIPDRWAKAVRRWSAHNERHRVGGLPDRNTEYLAYQTLVGTWPIEAERLQAYLLKAAREAKRHTSWTAPQPAYEQALHAFIVGVLTDDQFTGDLAAFLDPLIEPARVASLAQVLLTLTAPGIPDIYQGSELWDHSLVDPDNRRPVDYGRRRELLSEVEGLGPEEVWALAGEGVPKLWLIRAALGVRRKRPELFGAHGAYRAMYARGPKAAHAVAFARGECAVTVVPRLLLGLAGSWEGTTLRLGEGRWRSELGGETFEGGDVRVADLLRRFPVALLSREHRSPRDR
jgi:(1->4)-alpha-D-glucan 1-alpha-D-glucosylmutase